MEKILEVRGLTKHFNVSGKLFGKPVILHAVDDVRFDLYKGQTLGIVGESGSGKSTLARLILKLIQATSGSVMYQGRDIIPLSERESAELRRDMQMIFQDPYASLDPRIKVGEAIVEPLTEHKMHGRRKARKEKAIEMLGRVGLQAETYDNYPHEFSGGQRQRVNIARALVMQPKIIICDEAVSALDVSVQAQVLNLFNQLKAELDLTYMFISHDLSVVKFVSDTIIVMYLGEVMEMAPADTLFSNTAHPYTQALVSAIPDPDPEIRKKRILLEGDIPSAINLPPGCRFASRCAVCRPDCQKEHPALTEIEPGHFVRCPYYGQNG